MSPVVELLTALPIAAGVLLACISGGRFIFAFLKYRFEGAAEEIVFSAGLGLTLYATMLWAAGIAGGVSRFWTICLLTPFFAAFAMPRYSALPLSRSAVNSARAVLAAAGKTDMFFIFLSLVSLLFVFTAAGNPAPGHDALAYHFYCPQVFIETGAICPIPYNPNALQPFLTQMLFMGALSFGVPVAAQMTGPLLFMLLGLAAGSLTARHAGPRAGIWAAILMWLTPGLAAQAPYAYVDVPLSFFVFLSFYALIRYQTGAAPSALTLSGFFAGAAAAAKILAFQSLIGLFLSLTLILAARAVSVGSKIRHAFLWISAALVVMLPWYLRAYLETGNPVFPYFNAFFTGMYWPSDVAASVGIGVSALAFVAAPLRMLLEPPTFGGGDSWLGPVYFLLLIPALWSARERGPLRSCAVFAAASYVVWFLLAQHQRFFFPVAAAGVFLSAPIAARWTQTDKKAPRIPAMILFSALVLQAALILYYDGKLSRYAAHRTKEGYLSGHERAYEISRWIRNNLPHSRIAAVNETSLYYLGKTAARWEMMRRFHPSLPAGPGEAASRTFLKNKGYTHVLVRSTKAAEGNSDGLRSPVHEHIYGGEEASVYRLYAI